MNQDEKGKVILFSEHINSLEDFVRDAIKLMSDVDTSGRVCIMINKWKAQKLNQVCPYVRKWFITTAMLQYNFYSSILQDISLIHFPRLTKLFLRSNNIYSLETVNNLDMPLLKILWLGFNNIMSISSFRKCNLPQLESLTICYNKIQQFSVLTMMDCPKLRQLDLSRNQDQNNYFNLCTLAKIAYISTVFKLWQLKNGRIKQRFVLKSLKKKVQIECSFNDSNE